MTTIPMLEKELEQAYKDLNYYKNRNEKLNNQLQQKESIIKEVREYIEKHISMFKNGNMLVDMNVDELLEILDKVGSDEISK